MHSQPESGEDIRYIFSKQNEFLVDFVSADTEMSQNGQVFESGD